MSWIAWGFQGEILPLLTACGFQSAHNRLCDSLGWQGGDFAFPASFLILNEIMHTWETPSPLHLNRSGQELA